ncbi:MAG: efflux RND transporter periplasmic adaptor subunit, partial [Terrimicrobiaceae bacterium]|nr:efflux RND transporter periplasmic adaptor subunit [Terrimicrobiaceae bacterium]
MARLPSKRELLYCSSAGDNARIMPGKPAPFLRTGLSLLIVACAAGCKPPPQPPPAPQPRAVQLFTLDAAAESGFRSFPGEVAAVANLELSFDVGGRLIEFPVYDGMLLEAGQLVGRLEDNDFRAEADSARAQFLTARQEFDRQQQLFNRRVISRSELDRHREAFDIAEARLRTATKALEDTQLLAPFRGRVSHRFVRNFQNVNARQPIILLQDVSRLKVDIQLPEAFMSRLPPEATAAQAAAWIEARAEFAALPGRYFALALDSFAPRASPASRTFPVSFLLT